MNYTIKTPLLATLLISANLIGCIGHTENKDSQSSIQTSDSNSLLNSEKTPLNCLSSMKITDYDSDTILKPNISELQVILQNKLNANIDPHDQNSLLITYIPIVQY